MAAKEKNPDDGEGINPFSSFLPLGDMSEDPNPLAPQGTNDKGVVFVPSGASVGECQTDVSSPWTGILTSMESHMSKYVRM